MRFKAITSVDVKGRIGVPGGVSGILVTFEKEWAAGPHGAAHSTNRRTLPTPLLPFLDGTLRPAVEGSTAWGRTGPPH